MRIEITGTINRIFDLTKYIYLITALFAGAGAIKSFFFRHGPKTISFEPWELGFFSLVIMLWAIKEFRKEIKIK